MNAPTVTVKVEPDGRGWSVYVVTCGRYRAVLPMCERDECAPGGYMIECRTKLNGSGPRWDQHPTGGKNSVDAWLSHITRYCHGWHDGRVADFAATVAKTYGSHKPFTVSRAHKPFTVARAGNPARLAELLGWTVEDVVAELAKAVA